MSLASLRIWLDGALVGWDEATLHVLSQSAQRGSLVFDVMSCHSLPEGIAVFGMREHVERFLRSAELSGMALRYGLPELLEGIGSAVRANPGAEVVKVSAYFPSPSLDVLPQDDAASVAIAAFPLEAFGARLPRRSARLQIADVRKMPPSVITPQAKLAAGYLYTSVAKAGARKAGFDDVLLLDERGDLAESSTQSFFLVDAGVLRTAPLDFVLDGITRRVILEVAEDLGLPRKVEPLAHDLVGTADEAFMAGTTVSVWPVSAIGDRVFDPAPGPVTARLAERMRELLAGRDPRLSPRWMQPLQGGS